jgi:hypothetical protein
MKNTDIRIGININIAEEKIIHGMSSQRQLKIKKKSKQLKQRLI